MKADDGAGWSQWPAPAKLNLMLRIVGRRADGYHRLQTVFQLLDRGDTIALRLRRDGRVRCLAPTPGVGPEQDLVTRAARRLAREAPAVPGVDIRVGKRIPAGGGFGGGSSDAATVLRALDRLWSLGLGEDRLAGIGLELGADVPVFVRGHSAWAEEVGERLRPLALPPRWFLLLDPGVHVSTAELFQAPDLTRDARPVTIADFVSGRCVENAFQPVVSARLPRVAAALEALSRFGPARLTGSGGGCFVAFQDRGQAEAARVALAPAWRVWLARGVDRSPLLAALDRAGNVNPGASPSG
ncbi:MAG: 4-(cytidine 5'-diphospho)-2-C-methyl-D-erythritol kinase [Lysobacteraceae bacterium]